MNKKLKIEAKFSEFREIGYEIDEHFLSLTLENIPVLAQVDVLLQHIDEKGLKLTARGSLPAKVVELIAKCLPTLKDKNYMEFSKRFIEQEQVAAIRTRLITEVAKLVKVSKGKMHLSALGVAYLGATKAEQYLFLLHTMMRVNLSFFGRENENEFINEFKFPLLQVLRDKDNLFRETEVYVAFLCELVPHVHSLIDKEVTPTYTKNAYEHFILLCEHRLIEQFYVPFGLVNERVLGEKLEKKYQFERSELLEKLIRTKNAIDKSLIINKKRISLWRKRIKDENLIDVDVFGEIIRGLYLLSSVQYEAIIPDIAKAIVQEKKLLGVQADKQVSFYMEFLLSLHTTIETFTQFEKVGQNRDDLKKQFEEFIAVLTQLISHNDKPMVLFIEIQNNTAILLDGIAQKESIGLNNPNILKELKSSLSQEVFEDISKHMEVMAYFYGRAKKAKRITKEINELTHEAMFSYVLAILSLYTDMLEK